MNRRWFLAGLAALLVAGSVEARMHAPYRGHHIVPAAKPLDLFTQPAGAYSFRKLRTAYTGPAVKLQRVDTTTQDIGFTAAGDFDTAAAAAFCTTACTLNTWYDQSGNGRHLVQATAANQPQLIFNCNGTLPCGRFTTVSQVLASVSNLTPATGNGSFSAVARRTSGFTGPCTLLRSNGSAGNRFRIGAVAATWQLVGGTSGAPDVPAADNAWHAGQAISNAASSAVTIDGTTTAAPIVANTVAATVQAMQGVAGTSCDQTEAVYWDNYLLTASEIAALTANQRSFWGF